MRVPRIGNAAPFALAIVVFVLLLALEAPAAGKRSVTDRTPLGYSAAAAWLAGAGGDVSAFTEPYAALPDLAPGSTLVVTWPLSAPLDPTTEGAALLAWVASGNRAVLLLDGGTEREPPARIVEEALGVTLTRASPTPPYAWGEWEAWEASRERAEGPYGTIALSRPSWTLTCPESAVQLATGEDGHARACTVPRGHGEVVVISDATVWQNDHLARADNLAFLRAILGNRTVRFDEVHHGVAGDAPRAAPPHVPALFFLHLLALWLFGLWALSRRFGDPLPPPALPGPTMARALGVLAALHRGNGHAPAAAARLAALLGARAARRGVDPALLPAPPAAPNDTALTTYAARVATVQALHRL